MTERDAAGRPPHVTIDADDLPEAAALSVDADAVSPRLDGPNRRLAERHADLVHTERLSTLGLLASAVAHEINNPLAGVMACVRAIEEDTVPAERRAHYFDTIRDALERIERTVQSLLMHAHPGAGDVVAVDLHAAVESCRMLLSPTAAKAGVAVDIALSPGAAVVPAVRSELSQAIMNVMLNAVQAAPPNTAVRVDVVEEPAHLVLRVHDQGAGIPRAYLARVCEPFFTTKPEGEGTGLGLA
ncbi:MAG: hypothetical protein KC635_11585, partial [Myxococcales bacterium]|nr:hypothetical protein [Myxococcales bacterium]